MRRLQIVLSGLALAGFTFSVGCDTPTATSTASTSTTTSATHDHESHDHADHEGHDHEGHDHEGHDHAEDKGHDHAGHEGHDHENMTLESLLGDIEKTRGTIEAAYSKDSPEDAHNAMHDIFHLIEDLSAVAKKAKLDEAQTADVNSAQETLLGAFELLDAGLHDGEVKKYTEVAAKIKGAMEKLQAIASKKTE